MSNPFMPGQTPVTNAATTNMPTPGAAPMPGGAATNINDAFEVDLTDVQDGYTIPDGNYRAKCIDVTQDVSKGGNPMFVWEFELVGGDFAGRTFKSWTAITPAAMWKVAETVQALGVGQTGQVVKFKRGDVINKECGLAIEQDEYNGKMSSKISRVMSLEELNAAFAQVAANPAAPH